MPTPPSFDPGLTQKVSGRIDRVINPDGSFNVRRRGVPWRDRNLYLDLVSLSWPKFFVFVIAGYFLVNIAFASLYYWIGVEHLQGADLSTPWHAYLSAFFFSAQTVTTVGYGSIAPKGIAVSIVAAAEAMTGLLSFAIATGLLYGRFSRPKAKVLFSRQAVIAPYQDKTALMFRVVNKLPNLIIDLDATVMLMTVKNVNGQLTRNYEVLNLERAKIFFFPLTWTIVHPIDEASPLWKKTPEELSTSQAEIMILIRGFDDTFAQTVHARYSYRSDELMSGARFLPNFEIDEHGGVVVHVDKIHTTEPAELPI
jgi:inward rectifier potassium channel